MLHRGYHDVLRNVNRRWLFGPIVQDLSILIRTNKLPASAVAALRNRVRPLDGNVNQLRREYLPESYICV